MTSILKHILFKISSDQVANKLCTLASFVVPKKRGNQSTSEAAGEKSVLGKPEINIPKEALLRGLWKTDPKQVSLQYLVKYFTDRDLMLIECNARYFTLILFQLGVVKAELERANKERFWEEFSGALPEAAKLLEEIIAAEQ